MASREGREFVKEKAARTGNKGGAPKGSRLVGQLNKVASVQIALRLPGPSSKCWCMNGFVAKGAGREAFTTVAGTLLYSCSPPIPRHTRAHL